MKIYSFKDFLQLWIRVDRESALPSIQHLETKDRTFRSANRSLKHCLGPQGATSNDKDSTYSTDANTSLFPGCMQISAQYGRLSFQTTNTVLTTILKVEASDVFLDIGHGIGNTVLQAAFTTSCQEVRGIELVPRRHQVAMEMREGFLKIRKKERLFQPQIIDLRNSGLELPQNKDFLIGISPDHSSATMKVFFNNFNAVFADGCKKASDASAFTLDALVAGLFTLMKPGSMLVCLYPLPFACPPQDQPQREQATLQVGTESFYSQQEIVLGPANKVFCWSSDSNHVVKVYKYTRLHQENINSQQAVFLCPNPSCLHHTKGIPIPAVCPAQWGNIPFLAPNYCKNCRITPKNFRKRKALAEP